VHAGFWWGDLRQKDCLEDLGIDGNIIFKWIFKTWDVTMDWNDMAHDLDR
jgi:hypothetical protein